MRTIPAGIAEQYSRKNLSEMTLSTGLRIVRPDGQIFGFTTHDMTKIIGGVEYNAEQGLDVSGVEIAANTGVGNLELITLHDETLFTTLDILSGRWRNADFEMFRYDHSLENPTERDIFLVGNIGDVTIKDTQVIAEFRDLRQYLQQAVGDISTKTCRARLGDERCRRDLSEFEIPPIAVTDIVDLSQAKRIFTVSTLNFPHDWFGEGSVTWVTSANSNAGLFAKVNEYHAGAYHLPNGTFVLVLPMMGTIEVGDTFIPTVGCRKRLEEDCRDKFDNVLNFVGEPHRRGINNLTSRPD